ncbi:MAG: EF-hand domain-containing protein [Rhizobiales bacterium]|nr:EF-hand domain-containing protein [Hyphomicrobiales bacterium]
MTNTDKAPKKRSKTLMTATAIALVAAIGLTAGAQAFGGKDRGHGGHGGFMGGSMFMEGLDENSDGTISEAEVQAKLSSMFALADGNSDGSVTMEELTEARDAMMGTLQDRKGNGRGEGWRGRHDDNDGEGKHHGRKYGRGNHNDGDGDHRGGKFGKNGRGMQFMFNRADSNDDGKVSETEFADATSIFVDNIADRANRFNERMGDRFGELDKDGNGQISKEEFEAGGPGRKRN